MSPLTCESLKLDTEYAGWVHDGMHICLKMPLINHSLEVKSVPWMREHDEWSMQASGICDSQSPFSLNPGLPSPLKTADMEPGQQMHH